MKSSGMKRLYFATGRAVLCPYLEMEVVCSNQNKIQRTDLINNGTLCNPFAFSLFNLVTIGVKFHYLNAANFALCLHSIILLLTTYSMPVFCFKSLILVPILE
jgi:hypothetical protein